MTIKQKCYQGSCNNIMNQIPLDLLSEPKQAVTVADEWIAFRPSFITFFEDAVFITFANFNAK